MKKYIIALLCLTLIFVIVLYFRQTPNAPQKGEFEEFYKISKEVVAKIKSNTDTNDEELQKLVAKQTEAYGELGSEIDYISCSTNSIHLDYYYANKIEVYTYVLLDTDSIARRQIYISEIEHYLMLLEHSIK